MSDLVVSYQMGKVASSSITSSLDNCIQMHSWSPMNPHPYFSTIYHSSLKGKLASDIRWFFRYRKLLQKVTKANKPIKLIIGIREPVSRNISGYFQSLTTAKNKVMSVDECIQDFYVQCPHYLPLLWFDVELNKRLGINAYQYSFDQSKGYVQFSEKNCNVFIYQQEKLNSLESVIGDFLEMDGFVLKTKNQSKNKWYSELNKSFINQFVAPEEYLDSMYKSKYVNHFYSTDDVTRFREKWS